MTEHNHSHHQHHDSEHRDPSKKGLGKHEHHDHQSHHAHMVTDFRKRFWISLVITFPILLLSPMIRDFLGVREYLVFTGDVHLLFVLSSVVFFYGGYPFLKGIYKELKSATPGMITLIAIEKL